jgi:hypothetical protein
VRYGPAWFGVARQARRVEVGRVPFRLGRQGGAWFGEVWPSVTRQASPGSFWQIMVRRGRLGAGVPVRQGSVGLGRADMAGLVKDWPVQAWYGPVRPHAPTGRCAPSQARRVHPLGNIMGFWEVEAETQVSASVILACIRHARYAVGVPD